MYRRGRSEEQYLKSTVLSSLCKVKQLHMRAVHFSKLKNAVFSFQCIFLTLFVRLTRLHVPHGLHTRSLHNIGDMVSQAKINEHDLQWLLSAIQNHNILRLYMSMDDFQGLEQEQRCGQLESHKCVLTKHICAN